VTQEQRERATAHVDSLRTRAREFKEQLTATKRDMRRAGRTLKTYEARQRFELSTLSVVMASSLVACCMLLVEACSPHHSVSHLAHLSHFASNNPLIRASSCWRLTSRLRSGPSPSPHSSHSLSLSNSRCLSLRRLKTPQHWRTSATTLCCASWRRLRTRCAAAVALHNCGSTQRREPAGRELASQRLSPTCYLSLMQCPSCVVREARVAGAYLNPLFLCSDPRPEGRATAAPRGAGPPARPAARRPPRRRRRPRVSGTRSHDGGCAQAQRPGRRDGDAGRGAGRDLRARGPGCRRGTGGLSATPVRYLGPARDVVVCDPWTPSLVRVHVVVLN